MKLRKLLTAGLAMSMVFGLAACSSGNGGEKSGSGSGEDTITFATNVVGEKAEALEAACKAFEEETGYTVDFQAPGDSYEELMKTKMSANELPDVFTTHGWSVARYSDYLMTVNDLGWASDIDGQIKPVITNADGDMFVLPVDMDIAGIVYNVSVLEEADVDPDKIKTWDDFTAACGKIREAGKTPVHIGGKDNWTIGQFFDWAAPSYYYLPVMIAPLIMGYIMYFFFSFDNGALNDILAVLGIDGVDWLSDGNTGVAVLTIVNSLQFVGISMVIYLAGLQGIPDMYYEAAAIDGVRSGQKFRYITLPLLMPAVSSAVTINLIGGLKLFDIITALTSGGPGYDTHSLSTLVHRTYFGSENAGYASAI